MPREFEDPGELEDPEDLEDVLDPGLFLGLNNPGAREVRGLRLGAEKEKRHEEWHDGQDINNVHPVLEELYLLWRPCQPVKETILTSGVLIIDTPTDLMKYSRINQAMQTVSIKDSMGFSTKFP